MAQHAKKSVPLELKGKSSSDENDDNLMSSASSAKEEVAVTVKETIKPEEGQSSTLMSTKDGSGEFSS